MTELARDHDDDDDVPGETGVSGGNIITVSVCHTHELPSKPRATATSHVLNDSAVGSTLAAAPLRTTTPELRPRADRVQSADTSELGQWVSCMQSAAADGCISPS